jgi:capsular exopolysaccharide synthesis family protein
MRGNGKASRKERKAGTLPAVEGNGRSLGFEVITIHDGRSSQAEAFRTLRTNLLYGPDHERIRSVVVGSAMAGEGKTITAANLAVTLAQQGLEVVLVDCDLRKPRVDQLFGINRKPGMTELLMGKVPGSEAVRVFDPVPGLRILPAGTLPPNPTELLGGARTRELLRVLQERFDMVVLDTPPLAGGADSAILGAATDGILMVVRAGETDMEALRQAARQLHTVGARLLGAVINDLKGEVKKYDGYYYHYDYYGKGT